MVGRYNHAGARTGRGMSRETRLSKRDEALVDLLMETGMARNLAKTLVFLSKRDETTSVEIEKATGLRQPEVSIAMQDLRRLGGGRGAPPPFAVPARTRSGNPTKRPCAATAAVGQQAAVGFAGERMGGNL